MDFGRLLAGDWQKRNSRRGKGKGQRSLKAKSLMVESLEARALLATNVLGYHNDNFSTGANITETELTPANIGPGSFGKRYQVPLDGQVYAQPLYLSNINITTGPSQGNHRVVYTATEHNSLYAIDSDSGNVLWQTSFIDPANGVTTFPSSESGSGDLQPEIGITATPVIDLADNVIYVEAKTKEVRSGSNHYVHKLHRVNLSDGTYTSTIIADTAYNGGVYSYRTSDDPYTINDRTKGNADGAVFVGGQWRVYFNAVRQFVRPGLIIQGDNLYIASASHGDNGPYHGWILRYDISGSTPVLSGVLNTTPNGGLGGIWQGGGVPAIDSDGFLYFETGNGTFSPYRQGSTVFGLDANGFPSDSNYGDSFLKVGPDATHNSPTNQNKNGWGLQVVDYFTPFNEQPLDIADRDLGSAGPIVLPDSLGSAAHPHLLLGSGKEGKIYLIDRDNMGKSDPGFDRNAVQQPGGTDHVVQSVAGAVSGLLNTPGLANVGSEAAPDYRVYLVPGYGGDVRAFSIANGRISTSPVSQSNSGGYGYLSGSPSISQNGTANGIVWTIERNTHQLRAYDAKDLSKTLYTSAQAGGNRDQFLGTSTKFSVPTVADGRVFVGTSQALLIYGPPIPPTEPPAAPTVLTATAPFPSQISLRWEDHSTNEDLFLIERSLNGVDGWTQVGTSGVNDPQFNDGSVQASTTYFYRVRAFNSFNGGSYSDYTNIASAVTTPAPVGIGDGLLAVYYDNIDFTGPTVRRVDPTVNFDWGVGSPSPAIEADTFSVVWTGLFRATRSENYTFYTNTDDGVRLYVGGQLVIDNWTDHAPTEDVSAAIPLVSGRTYPIRMELYENGGGAVGQLRWSSPNTPKAIIPKSVLFSGTAPNAPTGLTATATSGTQIDLSWIDASTAETGFKIERKQGPSGTFEQVAIVNPNTTSYSDTGLLAGTTYEYRVRAANFVEDSAYSESAFAATPIPPATPSDAHVTAVSTTSIAFSWTDNSDNETKFSIFRKAGTSGSFIFLTDLPPNTTSYVDTNNISPGTNYDYHIQAANLGGYTDFAGFTVTTRTNPPAGVQATASGRTINVVWNAVNGADTYDVYRSQNLDGSDPVLVGQNLTTLSYTDTTPAYNTLYYYYVTTTTTGGSSDRSQLASARVNRLPGDADGDGRVTLADFALLRSNFGKAGGYEQGDFDGNGVVNVVDFAILRNNFGRSVSVDLQAVVASQAVDYVLSGATDGISPRKGARRV